MTRVNTAMLQCNVHTAYAKQLGYNDYKTFSKQWV